MQNKQLLPFYSIFLIFSGCRNSGDNEKSRPPNPTVFTANGLELKFPPGTSTSIITATDLSSDEIPKETMEAIQKAHMVFLLAFRVNVDGMDVQIAADGFTGPNTFGLVSGQAVVLQVRTNDPALLVDVAHITEDEIASASKPFPGVTVPGTFVVAAFAPELGSVQPVFLQGFVNSEAGPVSGAVVQTLESPFSALTDDEGTYTTYSGFILDELPVETTVIAEERIIAQDNSVLWIRAGSVNATLRSETLEPSAIKIHTVPIIFINIELIDRSASLRTQILSFWIQCDEQLKKELDALFKEFRSAIENSFQFEIDKVENPIHLAENGQTTFKKIIQPNRMRLFLENLRDVIPNPPICENNLNLKLEGIEIFAFELVIASGGTVPPGIVDAAPSLKKLDKDFELAVLLTGEPLPPGITQAKTALHITTNVTKIGLKLLFQLPFLQVATYYCPPQSQPDAIKEFVKTDFYQTFVDIIVTKPTKGLTGNWQVKIEGCDTNDEGEVSCGTREMELSVTQMDGTLKGSGILSEGNITLPPFCTLRCNPSSCDVEAFLAGTLNDPIVEFTLKAERSAFEECRFGDIQCSLRQGISLGASCRGRVFTDGGLFRITGDCTLTFDDICEISGICAEFIECGGSSRGDGKLEVLIVP
ncbi:MAG: hypothetical protein HY717_20595 [Planctomycetes bacterium]|nr:hypothetical protein [Planctomycetota bacterium]